MKNEAFYKKLTKQIKDTVKEFDFEKIKEKHKEIADIIGNCPLSCNDINEALAAGDAMCLSLKVKRTEACIADPTRLVIEDIVPTFMSADSFLDSSSFSLRKNEMAHGGFGGKSDDA